MTSLPHGTIVSHSTVLGLDLWLENGTSRFADPVSGQRLLTYRGAERVRRTAEACFVELAAQLRVLQSKD